VNFYWQLGPKSNFSLESYFYQAHQPEYGYGFSISAAPPTHVTDDVSGKYLLDMGYSYQVLEDVMLKLTVKNLLDQDQNEYLSSDPVDRTVLGEVRFSF
jgi:outer membrane receptor protein involved in Fe transport